MKLGWSAIWAVFLESGQNGRGKGLSQHNDTVVGSPGSWACLFELEGLFVSQSCNSREHWGRGDLTRHLFSGFGGQKSKMTVLAGPGSLWRFRRYWFQAVLWVPWVTSDLRHHPSPEWHPQFVLIVSVFSPLVQIIGHIAWRAQPILVHYLG